MSMDDNDGDSELLVTIDVDSERVHDNVDAGNVDSGRVCDNMRARTAVHVDDNDALLAAD